MQEGHWQRPTKIIYKKIHLITVSKENSKEKNQVMEDKCLETFLLKEFKSYEGGSAEAGREFQNVPEKGMND